MGTACIDIHRARAFDYEEITGAPISSSIIGLYRDNLNEYVQGFINLSIEVREGVRSWRKDLIRPLQVSRTGWCSVFWAINRFELIDDACPIALRAEFETRTRSTPVVARGSQCGQWSNAQRSNANDLRTMYSDMVMRSYNSEVIEGAFGGLPALWAYMTSTQIDQRGQPSVRYEIAVSPSRTALQYFGVGIGSFVQETNYFQFVNDFIPSFSGAARPTTRVTRVEYWQESSRLNDAIRFTYITSTGSTITSTLGTPRGTRSVFNLRSDEVITSVTEPRLSPTNFEWVTFTPDVSLPGSPSTGTFNVLRDCDYNRDWNTGQCDRRFQNFAIRTSRVDGSGALIQRNNREWSPGRSFARNQERWITAPAVATFQEGTYLPYIIKLVGYSSRPSDSFRTRNVLNRFVVWSYMELS